MKMKAVLCVLLLAALTGPSTALLYRNYIHVNKALNWSQAQAYCREKYVDLMTIESQKEYDRYQKKIHPFCDSGCWTGLSGNGQTRNFTQWSDGSLVNFTSWGQGNPNTSQIDADCVHTVERWYNSNCSIALRFICYTWEPQLIVVQEMKTWEEALKYCRTNYTDLVRLTSEIDHIMVNNRSSEILTPRFWTGLSFLDGSWFWVNKTSTRVQSPRDLSFMPLCPAPRFRCGAQNTTSNVLENRDCEERMNFMCYN